MSFSLGKASTELSKTPFAALTNRGLGNPVGPSVPGKMKLLMPPDVEGSCARLDGYSTSTNDADGMLRDGLALWTGCGPSS